MGDSLLAAPLILDLFVLTEIAQRITLREEGKGDFQTMHPVLSLLSYLTKAPLVPPGTPLVNALFKQRDCMVNIFRACVGLQPDNHMLLEHKLQDGKATDTTSKVSSDIPSKARAGYPA